jgi:hypothetical protein
VDPQLFAPESQDPRSWLSSFFVPFDFLFHSMLLSLFEPACGAAEDFRCKVFFHPEEENNPSACTGWFGWLSSFYHLRIRRIRMTELFKYMRDKLDRAADRILELLTGLNGYKVREVQERVPDVRKVIDARNAKRFPPSGPPCDRY